MPYSDATLFGLLVQGSSTEGVKEAAKVATKALKESTGLKGDALKMAAAKAKFAAASSLDGRDGIFSSLSSQVCPIQIWAVCQVSENVVIFRSLQTRNLRSKQHWRR
jgi:hypothetical protein